MDENSVYIVNPSGTLHSVNKASAEEKLKMPNWRLATEEEIARLNAQNGAQNMKSKTRIAPCLVGDPGRNPEDVFNDPNNQAE